MPIFEPPIVNDNPSVQLDTKGIKYRLFKFYGPYPRGRSVLKIDGTYRTVDFPDQITLASASEVYLGGHIYTVTQAVADALIAAGY